MENVVDSIWQGPGVIIGMFGNKLSSVYYRWGNIEADLNDLHPANRIFWYFTSRQNLSFTVYKYEIPVRYLVDPQALFS